MKIINLPRGGGKTVRLLYASEFNNAPILCRDYNSKWELVDQARKLGLNIPDPIVVSEVASGKLKGANVSGQDILVDEAHWVLQSLLHHLGMTGNIAAITLTSDELKQEVQK